MDQARQPTQLQCFMDTSSLTDVVSKIKKTHSEIRDLDLYRHRIKGKVCSCFYDKCNYIKFRELSDIDDITGGQISTRATDNELTTTGKNQNAKFMIEVWFLSLCCIIAVLFQ